MRVLHILNTSSYSGAENVAITIIKELEKDKNYEAYYVSPRGNIEKKLKEEGIKYIPINKLCVKELKSVIKEYKPDVIHAHDFRASIISSIATSRKIKVISHIHNNPTWIKHVNIYSLAFLMCSKKFETILLVSDSIKKEYIFSNMIKDKYLVIGNLVNIDNVIKKSREIIEDCKYDICFCGRLTEQKQPLKFIDLIKKIKEILPNINAIMIGDGNLKEKCEKIIKNDDLEKNIKLVGFLDNPYYIMKDCKVLCMTSAWEGYGLVAVEALVLKKPVVATNVGGIPTIIDDSCGKICDDNKSMENEIIKLLTDEDYYKTKSKKTSEKLNKINNPIQYVEKLKKVYEKN